MSSWGLGDDDWDVDGAAPASVTADDTPSAAGGGTSSADADLELLLAQVDVSALGKKVKPSPKPPMPAPPPKPPNAAAAADAKPTVELGFVCPYPEGPAQSWHFPSKVGGEPVWLLPERLPTDLRCRAGCGRPLRYLMQLYCPRAEVPHAYHRSLMLFCCGGPCLRSNGGWRALRCNLPEAVPWYVEQPDGSWTGEKLVHGREQLDALSAVRPAAVGGVSAATASAEAAAGSTAGSATVAGSAAAAPPAPALPELLIWCDVEGDWQAWLADSDAVAEAEASRLLEAYEASEAAQAGGGTAGDGTSGLGEGAMRPSSARAERPSAGREDEDDLAAADDEDVEDSFFSFQRRSSVWPQQSLRYNRAPHAEPLWAGMRGRPAGAPPCCPRCGAARSFEFQLMPQLLCEMEAHGYEESTAMLAAAMLGGGGGGGSGAPEPPSDGLDWGVVVVYTCSASCATADGPGSERCGYVEEHVWHQTL